MRYSDAKYVLSGLLLQIAATLFAGYAYAEQTNANIGFTDWGALPSVLISSDGSQPPYFQQVELGPPQQDGSDFGSSIALWKDGASGTRWAVIGAPGDEGGKGAAYVFNLPPNANQWHQVMRIAPNERATSDAFGMSVAMNANSIVIGAPGRTVGGHPKSGQAYIYTLDFPTNTLFSQGVVVGAASDNAGSGTSVAIAGNLVFVGAPNALSNGAVWFALRSGTTWAYTQAILPSGSVDGKSFGKSLAFDGARLLVGMPDDGIDGDYSGVAFSFSYSGSVWTQEKRFSAPDASVYNHFASSVAIRGNTIAIGARDHDSAKGGVYSFEFVGATRDWAWRSTLTEAGSSQFGFSVSLWDGELAVGAPESGGMFNGSLYVYKGSASNWIAVSAVAHDYVGGRRGESVAIVDDLVVVGCVDHYFRGNDGAADSLVLQDGNWKQLPEPLSSAFGENLQLFGNAVAISDSVAVVDAQNQLGPGGHTTVTAIYGRDDNNIWNWQKDVERISTNIGYNYPCANVAVSGNIVVVGDPGQNFGDSSISKQGAAYVYQFVGGSWVRQAVLSDANGRSDDNFGCSVSISGDTIAVGSPGRNFSFVFARNGSDWTLQQKLLTAGSASNDLFGMAVSVAPDQVAVGAPQHGNGAAYLFQRSGTTWTLQKEFDAPDPGTFDQFGGALAISGNTIAIGAFNHNSSGSVYLFNGAGSSWNLLTQFDGVHHNGLYGISVSLSGTRLLIGEGAMSQAFVFDREGSNWISRTTLIDDSFAYFGNAVSVSGANVIIGAPQDGRSGGRAYIFQDDRIFADGFDP